MLLLDCLQSHLVVLPLQPPLARINALLGQNGYGSVSEIICVFCVCLSKCGGEARSGKVLRGHMHRHTRKHTILHGMCLATCQDPNSSSLCLSLPSASFSWLITRPHLRKCNHGAKLRVSERVSERVSGVCLRRCPLRTLPDLTQPRLTTSDSISLSSAPIALWR